MFSKIIKSNPAAIRVSLKVALGLATVTFLSACQSISHDRSNLMSYKDRHPLVMDTVLATTHIPVWQNPYLDHEDIHIIKIATKAYHKNGHGAFFVDFPSGMPNTQIAVYKSKAIANYLVQSVGMDPNQIMIRTYPGDPRKHAHIKLGYSKHRMTKHECGHWPENLANMPANGQYWNFGCATQNNLGHMIADPQDLHNPRHFGAASGKRTYKAISQY